MPRTGQDKKAFLTSLGKSEAGNTLAITAAAVVPIIALIGGGVDVSRYYVVKSRLQAACDSAALAARKAMDGTTWSTDAETVGENFFETNYPAGTMGTTGADIELDSPTTGVVSGSATVTAPPTLMALFDAANKTISVECSAKMLLPNTDIVFALDTTGSMADTNPDDTVSRIQALRDAVNSFYTTLASAAPAGVTLRYGFVPFSSTVNVGKLLKREWMVDNWTYQSRIDNGTTTSGGTPGSSETTKIGNWTKVSGSKVSENEPNGSLENCVPSGSNTYSASPVTYSDWVYSDYPGGGTQRDRNHYRTETGIQYSASISSGVCKRSKTTYTNFKTTRTETVTPVPTPDKPGSTVYKWIYLQRSFDVSALKGGPADGTTLMSGTSFVVPKLGNSHANLTVDWAGCIEERKTLRSTETAVKLGEPFDLNIDLVPDVTDDDTRWRPFLPKLVYWRKGSKTTWDTNSYNSNSNLARSDSQDGGQSAACPTAAKNLATMTSSEVSSYLTSLTPSGFTYLDIGMIWAARLISPTGLFAASNSSLQRQRHIIYLTDGDIETKNYVYDAYGLSALDRRRTATTAVPTDDDQNTLVGDRFASLCTAVKNKGITVWVIAFGTELTDLLADCASDGRAFQADDAATLNEKFAEIAASIAQLRLTE